MTGISDPYEEPENPEITVDTENSSIGYNIAIILEKLAEKGLLS